MIIDNIVHIEEVKLKDVKKNKYNKDQKFLIYSENWHVVTWNSVTGFFDSEHSVKVFYGNRIHPTEIKRIFTLPDMEEK